MNDNDIIKALTHCVNSDCSTCPCDALNCSEKIPMAFAIDLINRQKAEIESLKIAIEVTRDNLGDARAELQKAESEIERLKGMVSQNEGVLPQYEALVRAEAIKEFADRLKGEFEGLAVCTVNSVANKISNLVKEMTEGQP